MSRSSGDSAGGVASAGTNVGSSTPSLVVPHCQQTSNDGSTLAPHFGQVHMPRSSSEESRKSEYRNPKRLRDPGLLPLPRVLSSDEPREPVAESESQRLDQFRRRENVAEVEISEKRVPGGA